RRAWSSCCSLLRIWTTSTSCSNGRTRSWWGVRGVVDEAFSRRAMCSEKSASPSRTDRRWALDHSGGSGMAIHLLQGFLGGFADLLGARAFVDPLELDPRDGGAPVDDQALAFLDLPDVTGLEHGPTPGGDADGGAVAVVGHALGVFLELAGKLGERLELLLVRDTTQDHLAGRSRKHLPEDRKSVV